MKDPDRRIRIGLVSPDLRRHSVAYFIEPFLAGFDRERFEVYCYPTSATFDDVSERFKGYATAWRPAADLPERDFAAQVDADHIDIAIDLAGHTMHNRMAMFALRIAPVQASYIGYPDTTGLANMDWRIVDSNTDPRDPAVNARTTERLYRLDPCFLCYQPPAEAPGPRPSDIRHPTPHINFGSFNAGQKHNRTVLSLWLKILNAVPNSRLILKSSDLADAAVLARMRARLLALGYRDEQFELNPHQAARRPPRPVQPHRHQP